MIDWTKPIEDKTRNSKIWKARGNETAQGGCYICGSRENVKEYAFGRLHVDTLEQHITADSHLAATKRYSYAPAVRRCLCDECLRWEYSHQISRQSFGVFLFFGLLGIVFAVILACYRVYSIGTGWAVLNVCLLVAGIGFLAGAFWELRPRKVFSEDNGDTALAVIYTGVSSNDIKNLGYYTRAESGKAPNDPLNQWHMG